MKSELGDTKEKLEHAQNDLSAWKFTPDRFVKTLNYHLNQLKNVPSRLPKSTFTSKGNIYHSFLQAHVLTFATNFAINLTFATNLATNFAINLTFAMNFAMNLLQGDSYEQFLHKKPFHCLIYFIYGVKQIVLLIRGLNLDCRAFPGFRFKYTLELLQTYLSCRSNI